MSQDQYDIKGYVPKPTNEKNIKERHEFDGISRVKRRGFSLLSPEKEEVLDSIVSVQRFDDKLTKHGIIGRTKYFVKCDACHTFHSSQVRCLNK